MKTFAHHNTAQAAFKATASNRVITLACSKCVSKNTCGFFLFFIAELSLFSSPACLIIVDLSHTLESLRVFTCDASVSTSSVHPGTFA